jgi:hypothetical protein
MLFVSSYMANRRESDADGTYSHDLKEMDQALSATRRRDCVLLPDEDTDAATNTLPSFLGRDTRNLLRILV